MAAFTTIAAGIGLAATAGSTGMSFVQAGKQNKLRRQAESDAAEAMAAARKKLDVNFYEQLAIQKEPYELAREASLVQGVEALQAGVEGEQRGAGAVAGRVQMAQDKAQADIRSAMGQDLSSLERLTAGEDSRLRDMQAQLDLGEVSGAQLAARDAQQAASQATQQGIQGVISMGQQAAAMAPLFGQSAGAKGAGQIQDIAQNQYGLNQSNIQKSIASLGTVDGVNLSGVAGMNPMQYQDFMSSLKPSTLQNIKLNLPITLSSFRPSEYGLQTNTIPGLAAYAIPGIGGY
jgi:hypothetical protein